MTKSEFGLKLPFLKWHSSGDGLSWSQSAASLKRRTWPVLIWEHSDLVPCWCCHKLWLPLLWSVGWHFCQVKKCWLTFLPSNRSTYLWIGWLEVGGGGDDDRVVASLAQLSPWAFSQILVDFVLNSTLWDTRRWRKTKNITVARANLLQLSMILAPQKGAIFGKQNL